MKAKPKKLFIILCLISMIGCTTTGQAYLPHTSRVFHAKKSCVGCYDPNPIVFQTVQAAASSGGIAPCSMCVKSKSLSSKNQGYTATNYATSGSSTGGSNSQKLPPAKSKSSVVARALGGILVTLGIVALVAASSAATPTQTYTPTPNLALQPRYSSSNYSNPSSVFNTTTPSYSSSGTSSNYGGHKSYNYDVSGTSYNGGYVWGNVDVDQNGGDGYIYDANGDSIYIDVDWTGKGELEGYGSDGNYYDLEVD